MSNNIMTLQSIQNISLIDLGRMGTAIVNNILKSGFNLVVYNKTSDKTRTLVESGAISELIQRKSAAKSDVILTSLRDDKALLEVVNGEEGILSGLRPNRIHIGTQLFLHLFLLDWLRCIMHGAPHI